MICEKHGCYEPQKITILGHELYTSCPLCEQEEIAKEKTEQESYERKQKIEKLKKLGVEKEFVGKLLKDYIPENATEKEAYKAVVELKNGKIKKLILLGDYGTGKTHLANALIQEHGNGIRITMFELSCRIRRGYNFQKVEIDVLEDLLEQYELFVIDELGRSPMSQAEMNWISYFVDKCHVRGKKIMLISNRLQAKNLPPERKAESFEMCLPNDAISRLCNNSKVIEIKGRDRRLS